MKSIVELWTPVLINDGIFKDDYLVSNLGRVKKKRLYKDGRYGFVLVHIIKSRRPSVKMRSGDKLYRKSVAKLVLSSFYYREGCECANITYLDGNMSNCQLSNLRYTADKGVYKTIEIKTKLQPVVKKEVKSEVIKDVVRSCEFCEKNPCFSGMENLSTDFGAVGCRKFKPR